MYVYPWELKLGLQTQHTSSQGQRVCQTTKQAPAEERVAAVAGAADGVPSSPLLGPPVFQSLHLQCQYL
jgi:hypothetical protein